MISSKAPNLSIAAKILLVGDEPDTVSEAQALIKNIKGKLIAISDPDQIVTAFDELEPQILLLASMEASKAEGYYLNLYRNSQKIQTTVHNTLLVCKAKDAEFAYQLCLRRVFDDYVIIRPLFDPFRLTISIRNLLAAQKMLDQSNELHQQMASIRSSTLAKNQLIQESLSGGASVSAQLSQSEEQLNQRVQKKFLDLAEQMTSHAYNGVVQVIDQAALNERLSRFSQQNLSGEISTAFKKPQTALDQLLKRSRASHGAQTQASTELDAWLNSIPTRILAVDDDPIFLEILTRMLANEGFEVLSATNAVEGLRTAIQLRPAAILLDYEMPEMSGLDFVARAKASPHLCRVPIIMLTGRAERETVRHAVTAGVSDFLIKSSPKEVILQKLRARIDLGRNPAKISAMQQ